MLARVAIVLALISCKSKTHEAPPAPAKPAPGDAAAVIADAHVEKSLSQELAEIRAAHKLPAVAAAAWRDGKLIEQAAVGVRKADDPNSGVTEHDLWHLGSNTKAMTATLVGIFVDRGKLHWDDTIGKLFGKVDPGYAKVTIDQLMHHEGGAPGEQPPDLWKQLWADADKPDARAKYVKGVLARKPAQEPGTFVYSNTGYVILGAALEKVTGKTWEQLMRDELFAKLDMKSCGFGPPGSKEAVDQPWGHDAGGTPIAPGPAADNPPGFGPAGRVNCSLEDYGKFLALHATGQPALLRPETLEHLHDAKNMGYAGGWMRLTTPKGSVLAHSGSNTMWYVTALVALTDKPENRYAFVMATNSGDNAIEGEFERLVRRHIHPK